MTRIWSIRKFLDALLIIFLSFCKLTAFAFPSQVSRENPTNFSTLIVLNFIYTRSTYKIIYIMLCIPIILNIRGVYTPTYQFSGNLPKGFTNKAITIRPGDTTCSDLESGWANLLDLFVLVAYVIDVCVCVCLTACS